jgi:antitoxin ChpS
MHKTNLRKVGGSVMLAVPPPILELLSLKPGEMVGLSVDAGKIVIDPHPTPKYTLEDLLAASDYTQARDEEEQDWLTSPPAGREIL